MADETLDQSWLKKLRNRPWIAAIVAVGVVLGGISSATNAIRDLVSLFTPKGEDKAHDAAAKTDPEEQPQATQDANDILGSWHWATYPDGRTMWVTVHSDGTLDSTIHTTHPDGTRSEEVNNTGRWSVAGRSPLRFELHWNSTPGNYVVTNFVTLSPDGRELLENDKGQEIIRGMRASR